MAHMITPDGMEYMIAFTWMLFVSYLEAAFGFVYGTFYFFFLWDKKNASMALLLGVERMGIEWMWYIKAQPSNFNKNNESE